MSQLISLIKNSPGDSVIQTKLRILHNNDSITSLDVLMERLEQFIGGNNKSKALIILSSLSGEINNIDYKEQIEHIPTENGEIIDITIDYVIFNTDRLYQEHMDRNKLKEEENNFLAEQGLSLELDLKLPTQLKELNQWPEGVPDYNMLGSFHFFQLGELPCYAKVGLDPENQDHLEVQMIWVDPEYRNKGLGTQMIKLLRKRYNKISFMPITKEGSALVKKLDKELNKN